jgi:hypothetical protein
MTNARLKTFAWVELASVRYRDYLATHVVVICLYLLTAHKFVRRPVGVHSISYFLVLRTIQMRFGRSLNMPSYVLDAAPRWNVLAFLREYTVRQSVKSLQAHPVSSADSIVRNSVDYSRLFVSSVLLKLIHIRDNF